jgi:cytosine permease
MATAASELPEALLAALENPTTDRRPWSTSSATVYIGLFLLIVYYDALARQTLAVGGLGPALLGALVGGLLCFGLLYYPPAIWGLRARQPLMVVVTSTFGAKGANWLPGLVLALAHVVWFAVAIDVAADVALRGLVAGGLVEADALTKAVRLGGLSLRGPLVLFVTLIWAVSAATIGIWFVRLAAAFVRGYAVFPALILSGAMIWALPGLAEFRPLGFNPMTGEVPRFAGLAACLMMIQLVFGFFATFGASAADWGAVNRDARDVRLGGLVGVAGAALILATIPLITVAGAQGRAKQAAEATRAVAPAQGIATQAVPLRASDAYLYRIVLQQGIGGYPGCVMLLMMGLPLLGPTCFSPFLFGHRFVALGPWLPRWMWSFLGGMMAWLLVASGIVSTLEAVFSTAGAAMAPVVGALAADVVRQRGQWPGPRRGWNVAGVVAWAVGLVVGLVPVVGPVFGATACRWFEPASVFAFGAAFVTYILLASLGLEPARLALPNTSPNAPPTALPSQLSSQ